MGKYIDMVMKRFAERKQAIEHNPEASEKDLRCLDIVERFLAHEKCFVTAEPLMNISTLKFLGYSDDEIRDMYFKVIQDQFMSSQYRYVDPESFD